MRPTRRLTRAALLVAACSLSACYFGTRVERFPAATSPAGATMRIVPRAGPTFDGELLAVADSGLFLMRGTRVTFAPYATLGAGHALGLGNDYIFDRNRAPGDELRTRLRQVSRFPQGLQPPLLDALLRLHRQPGIERLPGGSAR